MDGVRLLSNRAAYPALIQCIHGKDRTGLLVALVLLLCGVSEQDVCEDYLISGDELLSADSQGLLTKYMRPWVRAPDMLSSPVTAMQSAIGWMVDAYGGASASANNAAEAYMIHHGLTHTEIESLRQILVDAEQVGVQDQRSWFRGQPTPQAPEVEMVQTKPNHGAVDDHSEVTNGHSSLGGEDQAPGIVSSDGHEAHENESRSCCYLKQL